MIEVAAPAKLTLSLRITGGRADGYHLIDAEMVSLDFADRSGHRPRRLRHRGDGCGRRTDAVPADDDNLVARALRLCGRTAAVRIEKHIPPGAGLGGGSADAAAVLRWAGFDDVEAAAGIGADVAFCLRGGRARVTGIGERIEPPLTRACHVHAAHAAAALFDAGGLRLLGRAGRARGRSSERSRAGGGLRPIPSWPCSGTNWASTRAVRPRLAGSGGTWFVEGAFRGARAPGRVQATGPAPPCLDERRAT